MPNSGDVLFYRDFVFEDGSKGNKLFIVLCSKSVCLALKTTSDKKGYYRGAREGCNPKRKVFLIPEKKEGFPANTYVQFPLVVEITIPELIKGGQSKKIEVLRQPISSGCLQLIRDCLKYFKDDISGEHWEQIFSGVPNTPSTDSLQKLASKFKTH